MARTETAPAHGWFPDPESPGLLRMWDGHAWTRLTKYPSHDEEIHPAPPEAAVAPLPDQATRTPHDSTPRPRPRPMPTAAPRTVPRSRPDSAAPSSHSGASHATAPAAVPPEERGLETIVRGNPFSVGTMGAALVFIVLAVTVGVLYLAVIPVVLAARAYQVREQMAPIAILAAFAVLVVALVV